MATKHLLKFKTEADYKTAKRNHLVLPNVSSIEESGNTYINGRFTTKEKAEAGTIIAYHEHSPGEYEVKYIVPEAFDKNDTYWKADAIVVVPYSHTGDGTVRAMGLNYASYTTPSTGGNGDTIIWGTYSDIEELQNYSGCIKFSNYKDQTLSTHGTIPNVNLPSDSFSGNKVNPYDTETVYTEMTSNYAPSPYNEDGSKNDAYHSLGDFARVTDNYLKDMDGKGNTLKILRNLNQDYLNQTLYADSLDNGQTKTTADGITLNLFPAACACAKYNTILKHCNIDIRKTLEENIADNAMPWYLPSCGELGYMMVRLARIQYALSQADGIALGTNQILLSSTEFGTNSSNLVTSLNPSTGIVYSRYKNITDGMVRPFAAY